MFGAWRTIIPGILLSVFNAPRARCGSASDALTATGRPEASTKRGRVMKKMKRAGISVSLAALALGAMGGASAQSAQEVVVTGTHSKAPGAEARSQTVKFADLDLSKSQGVKTLLTRIRAAAGEVCSPRPEALDVSGKSDYSNCIGRAVAGAVETVNSPLLTAMASTRTK